MRQLQTGRLQLRTSALLLAVVGGLIGSGKIMHHLSGGGSVTFEGCQGASLTLPVAAAAPLGHCWGCYLVVACLALGLLTFLPRGHTLAR